MIKLINILTELAKQKNENYTWTSTRTDQLPNSSQNKPEAPVNRYPTTDRELWKSDVVKNRFERMKKRLYYDVKNSILDFIKYKHLSPPENFNKSNLKRYILNTIQYDINEYFFNKLKKKHNITFSEKYFQEVPSIVDTIINKVSDNITQEEINKLWPEFRSKLRQMFNRYEYL
jgi:hypothetical protein